MHGGGGGGGWSSGGGVGVGVGGEREGAIPAVVGAGGGPVGERGGDAERVGEGEEGGVQTRAHRLRQGAPEVQEAQARPRGNLKGKGENPLYSRFLISYHHHAQMTYFGRDQFIALLQLRMHCSASKQTGFRMCLS